MVKVVPSERLGVVDLPELYMVVEVGVLLVHDTREERVVGVEHDEGVVVGVAAEEDGAVVGVERVVLELHGAGDGRDYHLKLTQGCSHVNKHRRGDCR